MVEKANSNFSFTYPLSPCLFVFVFVVVVVFVLVLLKAWTLVVHLWIVFCILVILIAFIFTRLFFIASYDVLNFLKIFWKDCSYCKSSAIRLNSSLWIDSWLGTFGIAFGKIQSRRSVFMKFRIFWKILYKFFLSRIFNW